MNRLTIPAIAALMLVASQFAQAQVNYQEAVEASKNRPGTNAAYYCCREPNCVPTCWLPRICLQSTFGSSLNPKWPSGAFTLSGLCSGKGIFTWNSKCHVATMRFTGRDKNYWYYRALGTHYCFIISRSPITIGPLQIHIMYLYNQNTGQLHFYQFATKYPC